MLSCLSVQCVTHHYVIIPYSIGLDHCTDTQMSLDLRGEIISFVLKRSKTRPKSALNTPRANLKRPFFYFPEFLSTSHYVMRYNTPLSYYNK